MRHVSVTFENAIARCAEWWSARSAATPSRGAVNALILATLMTFAASLASVHAADIFGPPGLQPVNIGGGVDSPGLAVTADFNNDGYPDLAVLKYNSANGTTNLAIFTSNAIGTLTLAHDYGIFNFDHARDIVAADVNGDGKIDLVVSDDLGVSILLGGGDPTASFAAANPQRPYQPDTVGTTFRTIVADLNGDGKPDLITESSYGSGVYVEVLFGSGGGKFEFAIQYDVGYAEIVGLAKVDGDSIPDLVLVEKGNSSFYVMKGVGNGLFLPTALSFNYASTIGLVDVSAVADLDGDGKVDVLMQNLVGKGVWMAKGNGNGTFQAPTQLFATGIDPCCNRGMGVFQIADVNGDGRLDIVSDGYVALQQPNHSFVINEHIGYTETYMLAALDLNGDGRADIVTAGPNPWDTRIAVFMSVAGAASVVTATGTPQSTPFNTAFANPLTVTVKDSNNIAVPGIQVTFTVPFGVAVASATPFGALTDAQGKVSYTPTANGVLGCYQVKATIATVAVTPMFDLCNTGANTLNVLPASTNQTTLINTAFPTVIQVQLKDNNNIAVSGATVTFSKPTVGASAVLAPTSGVTDGSGVVFVNATANGIAGTYNIVASAPGATPSFITLHNSAPAGAAANVAVDVNTPQYAYVTRPFSGPIILHVTDFFNNPVQGATVVLQITPDATTGATATFSSLTAVSNAQGNAQVTATANGFIGQYSMKVSLQGNLFAAPKTFALKNVADLPKFMTLASGTPQSTFVNTAFAQKLRVKVTDSLNAATPQVRVFFSTSGNAILTPSSALADANGFAEVTATANGVVGSYQVGAIVFDTSTEAPITQLFNLTNLAAIPTFALTVTKSGTGSGTVTATGVDCGVDCNEIYAQGTVVSLAAVPVAGSTFVGWSGGGCSGIGACMVNMNAAQTVNAQFDVPVVVIAHPVPTLHPLMLALLALLAAVLPGAVVRRKH